MVSPDKPVIYASRDLVEAREPQPPDGTRCPIRPALGQSGRLTSQHLFLSHS